MKETLRQRPDLWDLYARKEEYVPGIRDKYDRFPRFLSESASVLDPRVSSYIHENGFHPKYPKNREFAVCLSHDIDFLQPAQDTRLTQAVSSLIARDPRSTLRHLRPRQKTEKLYWTFDLIASLEKKADARSTFFFLAQCEGEPDYTYGLEEVSSVFKDLAKGGWEIALHGGIRAYEDLDKLRQEKGLLEKNLGKVVTGYRGHFLKFRVPDTWEKLSQAGFKYDSTLYFADTIGFRNGMCHPYRPFNLRTDSEIDLLEVPLSIMDTTLFDYMRLNPNQAWQACRMLLEKVKSVGGAISLLWHNSSMHGEDLELYERILGYCRDERAWLTSMEELVAYWNEKYCPA
jgi:peptidoglycan/xylan/chitin deacetylase (PgdA/CDA1 family)